MSNFNWQTVQTLPLGARYYGLPPNDALGLAEWEAFVQRLPFQRPQDAWPWLQAIHAAGLAAKPRTCPRVFVSHRHNDVGHATRVAWLAHQEAVEYWLDVIDIPAALAAIPAVPTGFNQTILIAAIIEMALINCTHVLAVMTPNTAGSGWVPYEYGRIKDDPPGRLTASCWRHRDLPRADLPEYLLLAPIHDTESDIRDWLRVEKSAFPSCVWAAGDWSGEIPEDLPAPEPD